MEIKIVKKSSNKFAWYNSNLNKVVKAEIEKLDKNDKDSRLVYIVKCNENEHINFNKTWDTCFIEISDAIQLNN